MAEGIYIPKAAPLRSGGSERLYIHASEGIVFGPISESEATEESQEVPVLSPGIMTTFEGFGFDDNARENDGVLFILPDPIGAAGIDRVIAVVNTMIETRRKNGALIFKDSLQDFFSPLGNETLGTFPFDPKVIFDPFENRFVVVTLERTDTFFGDPADALALPVSPDRLLRGDWQPGADPFQEGLFFLNMGKAKMGQERPH